MKIIIDQEIMTNEHGLGTFRKQYNSELIPVPGMFICDLVWKDGEEEIKHVSLNPMEKYYFITVKPYIIKKENFAQTKKMFESHGWIDVLDIDKNPPRLITNL